jgi:hypothetical protein
MRSFVAATVWALALSGYAYPGTIDENASQKDHIEYGRKFTYVLRLTGVEPETGYRRSASCVAISPRWVVTSAHVVKGAAKNEVIASGSAYPVSRVVIHDRYEDRDLGWWDVALCETESDLPLDFFPSLYSGEDEAGKTVSIAGFGITGTFQSGSAGPPDGVRRAGSNIIDRVEYGAIVCSVGSGRKTSLEICISPGDSGGGLFIGNSLAGINSFISGRQGPPKGRSGEESHHTRISRHKGWIDDITGTPVR